MGMQQRQSLLASVSSCVSINQLCISGSTASSDMCLPPAMPLDWQGCQTAEPTCMYHTYMSSAAWSRLKWDFSSWDVTPLPNYARRDVGGDTTQLLPCHWPGTYKKLLMGWLWPFWSLQYICTCCAIVSSKWNLNSWETETFFLYNGFM